MNDAAWWARVVQARTERDDLRPKRVWVLHKEGREATIDVKAVQPCSDDLRALLIAQQAAKGRAEEDRRAREWSSTWWSPTGRGGAKQPKPIRAFTKAWKTACIAAGCPGRIPHEFRRTAIRNTIRRGVPERVAMQLAGHRTRSMFDRYNIVSDGDLRTAARQFSGQTRDS
jgi:integrase